MILTIFVRNKHIIIRIIHSLNSNFFLVCNLLIFWEYSVKIFWFCVPRALLAGQKSDKIYLVVLTIGVRVVLFYSEVSDLSATDYLS